MNTITWPEGYIPGLSDNFASNEMIVAGLTVEDLWPFLNTPALWPTYYQNAGDIRFYNDKGPEFEQDVRFFFTTFGFGVEAQVTEYEPPKEGEAARIAWHGWSGEGENRLDVHHAWLLENLPGNRVRILTQETQNGEPARVLAVTRPNPMINGHQQWLDGLISAAQGAR